MELFNTVRSVITEDPTIIWLPMPAEQTAKLTDVGIASKMPMRNVMVNHGAPLCASVILDGFDLKPTDGDNAVEINNLPLDSPKPVQLPERSI